MIKQLSIGFRDQKLTKVLAIGALFWGLGAQAAIHRCNDALRYIGNPSVRPESEVKPKDTSNSVKYEWLETLNEVRERWVQARSGEHNRSLQKSENKKPIEDWLRKSLDVEQVLQKASLNDTKTIQLIDRGLGKPTELVEIDKADPKKQKVLFSSFQIKKNTTATFLKFSLSQSKKRAALSFVESGATDNYRIVTLDLKNGKVVSMDLKATSKDVVWTGAKTFLYQKDLENFESRVWTYDFSRPNHVSEGIAADIIESNAQWALISTLEGHKFYSIDGKSIKVVDTSVRDLIGQVGDFLYFKTPGANKSGEIRRVSITEGYKSDAPARSQVIWAETEEIISDVSLKDEYLIAKSYFGHQQKLLVLDPQGALVAKIKVPKTSSVIKTSWEEVGKKLAITLSSEAVKSQNVTFDIYANRFVEEKIDKLMMVSDGNEYSSYVIEAKSADGTLIPVRLTHLKKLKRDGSNPALIETYGGFSHPNQLYPAFSFQGLEFMKRGGILVGPGVRGGNEWGEKWHTPAMRDGKIKTFEDLAATSDYLIANNYTQPEKVIITGASNGGMVVASAALHFPSSFGLVIPINGVQDMLGKEKLDARFGSGWVHEYGDSRIAEARVYLDKFSPVEAVSNVDGEIPEFLIINGRNDSRVNPVHSFKLLAALLEKSTETNISAEMTSIKNGGHWLQSAGYQNMIGWRTNVVIWTKIFDFLGWKFQLP